MLKEPVTLSDLVSAYLRFKEWMDCDAERSAYCAMEIMIMQRLFGTRYVIPPGDLGNASYEQLLIAMTKRQADLRLFTDLVHESNDEDTFEDVVADLRKTTFFSKVGPFATTFQVLSEGAFFDSHFYGESPDELRAFILSEFPAIEKLTFSKDSLYEAGLPKIAPEPPDHVFTRQ